MYSYHPEVRQERSPALSTRFIVFFKFRKYIYAFCTILPHPRKKSLRSGTVCCNFTFVQNTEYLHKFGTSLELSQRLPINSLMSQGSGTLLAVENVVIVTVVLTI